MKREQIKYAMDRLQSLFNIKEHALQQALHYDRYDRLEPLVTKEKIVLSILNGECKPLKNTMQEKIALRHSDTTHLYQLFDMSPLRKGDLLKVAEAEQKKRVKEYHDRREALVAEFTKVRDQLMLGDAQDALAAIKQLEGKTF